MLTDYFMSQRQDFDFNAMGCPCRVSVSGNDKKSLDYAGKLAYKECLRLDRKYSRFIDTSLINTINQSAGTNKAFNLDSETAALIDFAFEAYQLSEGLMDITIAPLIRLWDFHQATLPDQPTVEIAKKTVGLDKITWKDGQITIPKGMSIDLDGIVKEYAADRMIQLINQAGVSDALVNLGGDIRAIGSEHSNKTGWNVSISDPENPEKALRTITLVNQALATSGTLERGFERDGTWYTHIINPLTAYPIEQTYSSLSVIHDHCIIAGMFATIALIKARPEGALWLKDYNIQYFINDD